MHGTLFIPEEQCHTHGNTDHAHQKGEVIKWSQQTSESGESSYDAAILVALGDRELCGVGVEQVFYDGRVSHYQHHHQEVHTQQHLHKVDHSRLVGLDEGIGTQVGHEEVGGRNGVSREGEGEEEEQEPPG